MKKLIITLLKISISLLIIGYLVWSATKTPSDRDAFAKMLQQPKRWDLLVAAFVVMLTGIMFTMIRWWYLVRKVGIPFSFSDSLRIGFLGYLFNLAPMGIVGGDLLKAWMLSREKPGNRAKAFASVIVDRIVGLYVLFIVASIGVFATGFWSIPNRNIHLACTAVVAITAGATVAMGLGLIPGVLGGSMLNPLTRLPKVGPAIGSLLDALRIYRSEKVALAVSFLLTIPVHVFLTTSVILIAFGMRFVDVPWQDYFAIFPVSGIASTIPLPAGPTETGIVYFYKYALLRASGALPTDIELLRTGAQHGLILALAYRLCTILIAPIGAAYYFLGDRSEVDEVMSEADEG